MEMLGTEEKVWGSIYTKKNGEVHSITPNGIDDTNLSVLYEGEALETRVTQLRMEGYQDLRFYEWQVGLVVGAVLSEA